MYRVRDTENTCFLRFFDSYRSTVSFLAGSGCMFCHGFGGRTAKNGGGKNNLACFLDPSYTISSEKFFFQFFSVRPPVSGCDLNVVYNLPLVIIFRDCGLHLAKTRGLREDGKFTRFILERPRLRKRKPTHLLVSCVVVDL